MRVDRVSGKPIRLFANQTFWIYYKRDFCAEANVYNHRMIEATARAHETDQIFSIGKKM